MLILASASPRRKALLENAGMEFITCPAEYETNPALSLPPDEYAVESAFRKAKEVSAKFDNHDIILGADTIVYHNGEIIGKPKDKSDAFDILRRLSGNTHAVYTGYALIRGETVITGFEVTEVTFRTLDDEEIREYTETGEPMDKAGAYGVQGKGSVFVSRIVGDFYNVMGLPICSVYCSLKSIKNIKLP
ncbi:MAG: Maf family protein [Eubacteriales bacterium]|nr:Maf family protein [Eubacteriales bacterium]